MEPTTHPLVTGPPEPRGSAMPKSASGPHRVEIHASRIPPTSLGTLAVGVVTVAALYFGREVFVPLALAVLLSFALAPLVLLLRRWHLGRVPSVIVSVLLAFLVIFAIGTLIGGQLARLAEELPRYQNNIVEKIHALRGTAAGSGIVGRASEMVEDLKDEITKTEPPADDKAPSSRALAPRSSQQQQPFPVELHQPAPTALQIIHTIIGPLVQPLATTGIVIIFLIFFLLQREDLRDRFIRLAGARDLQRTTQALDDAGRRLSRYLLMQSAINATFGAWIGIGLWLIGVPNPILWGTLSALLRFV